MRAAAQSESATFCEYRSVLQAWLARLCHSSRIRILSQFSRSGTNIDLLLPALAMIASQPDRVDTGRWTRRARPSHRGLYIEQSKVTVQHEGSVTRPGCPERPPRPRAR